MATSRDIMNYATKCTFFKLTF